jgi:hypothetical protein
MFLPYRHHDGERTMKESMMDLPVKAAEVSGITRESRNLTVHFCDRQAFVVGLASKYINSPR